MYALRDSSGQFVARARSRAAAYRKSRTRRALGASVNRAGAEVSNDSLFSMAREAGRAGQSWNEWSMSDDVQDRIMAMTPFTRRDQAAIEAAFQEGYRQHKLASGWRTLWTTAPADYDGFGTETIEEGGEWRGKTLRRVIIDPVHFSYQTARYASGLHGDWDEDPRVVEANMQTRLERDRVERAARESKRLAGLEWLKTATEDELEDFDTFESRGVQHQDVRAEKKRRQEHAAETASAAEWARCIAIVSEGSTLLDRGEPARRGQYGVIPGRSSHVYYDVRIVRGWPDDADHANVVGEGKDVAGSLCYVADWIVSGRLEIVGLQQPGLSTDDVPPRPVVQRIGHEHVKDIRRVDVEGRSVWVGRATFGEQMVLDEKGRIVRAKKVLAAVREGTT